MRREPDKGKAQAPTRSHLLASLPQSTLLAGLLQGPQHCSSQSANSVFMVGLDGTVARVALNSRDEWRAWGVEERKGPGNLGRSAKPGQHVISPKPTETFELLQPFNIEL
jgi:hypothetical protein